MTWNYNSKLHGLNRECGDTGLIKRQKMFLCHTEDVHIKGLVIKAHVFKHDLRARLERSAFLAIFFSSSC